MDKNIKALMEATRNIRKTSPLLLLDDAVVMFKRMYSGPIKYIGNTEDVRDLVSYYYGVSQLDHPLVIEDLTNVKSDSVFLLLKLVEESKFPIVLLSIYDSVSPIILSRCRTILKFSIAPVDSQFLPAYKGKEVMDEYLSENSDVADRNRWYRDNSPMLYYYSKLLNKSRNIDKILNLLM